MDTDYSRVRETVACFENSSPCTLLVTGQDAEQWLNTLFTKELEDLPPLKGLIGLFLNDVGGVIAIANIFRDEDDRFYVFAESLALKSLLINDLPEDVEVRDLSETHRTLVAVGPLAQDVMTEIGGEDILSIPYMGCEESEEHEYLIFRQGFGGEFEFRLLIENDKCDQIKLDLEQATESQGGGTVDPEIMDLICFEMRSIREKDVIDKATPLEAGLHWMIDFQKEDFVGRRAVAENKEVLNRKSLIVCLAETGIAQDGANLTIEKKVVGQLARVAYSPRLGNDIAFAYLDRDTGWVGVSYSVETEKGHTLASAMSSPLFVARSGLSD